MISLSQPTQSETELAEMRSLVPGNLWYRFRAEYKLNDLAPPESAILPSHPQKPSDTLQPPQYLKKRKSEHDLNNSERTDQKESARQLEGQPKKVFLESLRVRNEVIAARKARYNEARETSRQMDRDMRWKRCEYHCSKCKKTTTVQMDSVLLICPDCGHDELSFDVVYVPEGMKSST